MIAYLKRLFGFEKNAISTQPTPADSVPAVKNDSIVETASIPPLSTPVEPVVEKSPAAMTSATVVKFESPDNTVVMPKKTRAAKKSTSEGTTTKPITKRRSKRKSDDQ